MLSIKIHFNDKIVIKGWGYNYISKRMFIAGLTAVLKTVHHKKKTLCYLLLLRNKIYMDIQSIQGPFVSIATVGHCGHSPFFNFNTWI